MTQHAFSVAVACCYWPGMNISPQSVLQKCAVLDSHVAFFHEQLWSEVKGVTECLRAHGQPAAHSTANKIAKAVVRNAAFGFEKGIVLAEPLSIFAMTPSRPLDLRAMHLPGRIGRFLGPAGVLAAGRLFVGSYAPVGPGPLGTANAEFIQRIAKGGLAADATAGLQRLADRARTAGYPLCGQACLWGAALIGVAAASLRCALAVPHLSLCIAGGIWLGGLFGISAGLWQFWRGGSEICTFEKFLQKQSGPNVETGL